jgi:hypothetical protein
VSTEEGRQIDWRKGQPSNADSPRFERLEPASNATSERTERKAKQDLEMALMDEGMQIRLIGDEE